MRQVFGPGALGRPRGSGWRGRWEGGSGWGTHNKPMAVSFQCMTKFTTKEKKMEKKNHMIIPIDAEKEFGKSQYPFMIKKYSQQSWHRRNILQSIYDKPIANTTLNGEELKAFPLKPGRGKGCILSQLLFNIVLKDPSRAIREGKK